MDSGATTTMLPSLRSITTLPPPRVSMRSPGFRMYPAVSASGARPGDNRTAWPVTPAARATTGVHWAYEEKALSSARVNAAIGAGHPYGTPHFRSFKSSARRYLEIHQSSADAHYLLGYILFREGNPKPSLAEYTEGARYRAPSALDLETIGSNYFLMEDYAAADRWLTKSLELAPNDAHARYYLARAKYNQKRFADAVRIFIECLELDPLNAQAADYLGRSYEALGRTEDALPAYRTAIALDTGAAPGNPEPYLDLGTLLVENNRPGDAIPYLVQAAGIAPGDWRAHRELGKAYLQLNRLPEAREELRKAVALAPENGPLHFLLAQALRM